jgi:hypothetical protein
MCIHICIQTHIQEHENVVCIHTYVCNNVSVQVHAHIHANILTSVVITIFAWLTGLWKCPFFKCTERHGCTGDHGSSASEARQKSTRHVRRSADRGPQVALGELQPRPCFQSQPSVFAPRSLASTRKISVLKQTLVRQIQREKGGRVSC